MSDEITNKNPVTQTRVGELALKLQCAAVNSPNNL
jgi:hypothetical protein